MFPLNLKKIVSINVYSEISNNRYIIITNGKAFYMVRSNFNAFRGAFVVLALWYAFIKLYFARQALLVTCFVPANYCFKKCDYYELN